MRISNPAKLAIAHNALAKALTPRPSYYIEDVTVNKNNVEVVYIDQALLESGKFSLEDFKEVTITHKALCDFVVDASLNYGTIDSSTHEGGHLEVYLHTPVAEYISENLNEVVKNYIQSRKEPLV